MVFAWSPDQFILVVRVPPFEEGVLNQAMAEEWEMFEGRQKVWSGRPSVGGVLESAGFISRLFRKR